MLVSGCFASLAVSRLKCFFFLENGWTPQSEHGKNFSPSWVFFVPLKKRWFRSFPNDCLHVVLVEKHIIHGKGKVRKDTPQTLWSGFVSTFERIGVGPFLHGFSLFHTSSVLKTRSGPPSTRIVLPNLLSKSSALYAPFFYEKRCGKCPYQVLRRSFRPLLAQRTVALAISIGI